MCRRCSLNSFLRESIGRIRTHFFGLLAGIEPFSRSKTGDREAPIGPKSCPPFAVVVQKNNRALLDQVDRATVASTRKNRRKKGIASVIESRTRPLLGPDRIRSEIVGLFPSPAAQPAPRVHSSLVRGGSSGVQSCDLAGDSVNNSIQCYTT